VGIINKFIGQATTSTTLISYTWGLVDPKYNILKRFCKYLQSSTSFCKLLCATAIFECFSKHNAFCYLLQASSVLGV